MHLRCIRDVEDAIPCRNGQSTTYKIGAKRPLTFNSSLSIYQNLHIAGLTAVGILTVSVINFRVDIYGSTLRHI